MLAYHETFFCNREERKWLAISAQTGLHKEYMNELEKMASIHPELQLVTKCPADKEGMFNYSLRCQDGEVYQYPHILQVGTYLNNY